MDGGLVDSRVVCAACIQGKSEADPTREFTRPPSIRPGQRINADIIQYDVTTVGGNKVCLIAKDDYSGWMCDIPMVSKRESNLVDAVTDIISFMNKNGHKVDTLATDHENCLGALETILESRAIILDQSVPGRHQTVIE